MIVGYNFIMTPKEIESKIDFDLFQRQDKRVYELLAILIEFANDNIANLPPYVYLALEELKDFGHKN